MTDRVADKFIALKGLRFHYRDWAAPSPAAPTLVILHGLGYNARSWDPIARVFNARYRVLALDQRGHGESDWSPSGDYAFARFLDDATAFIAELGLKRFSLLAHSLGGRVAYTLTAAHPETVERLVIVDMGPEIMTPGASRISAVLRARDSFESLEDAYQFARTENPRPPETEQRERTRVRLKQRDDGQWVWQHDPALRSRPMPQPDSESQWAALAKISCPTLIVRGAASDVFARATAEQMVRVMPQARWVEIANAGHSPQFDNPSGFLKAVKEFLV
jgi:pimeloyl-ACP methyl ester carboxylesterase